MIGRTVRRLGSILPGSGGENGDGAGGGPGEGDGQAGDDGADSIWDAIPSWQYEGMHVHQGGLSRAEQEEAIAEVHQRAAEIERGPFSEDEP